MQTFEQQDGVALTCSGLLHNGAGEPVLAKWEILLLRCYGTMVSVARQTGWKVYCLIQQLSQDLSYCLTKNVLLHHLFEHSIRRGLDLSKLPFCTLSDVSLLDR